MSPDTSSSSRSTPTRPAELPFRLKLNAAGGGLIEVNGVDMSGVVGGLALDARPRAVTRLVLELVGRDVELEGLGEVCVVRRHEDLAALLDDIDPDELEREALRRLGSFEDRSATAVMLDVLRDWVRSA